MYEREKEGGMGVRERGEGDLTCTCKVHYSTY